MGSASYEYIAMDLGWVDENSRRIEFKMGIESNGPQSQRVKIYLSRMLTSVRVRLVLFKLVIGHK